MSSLFDDLIKKSENKGSIKIIENLKLSKISSFGIGGNADYYVLTENISALLEVVKYLQEGGFLYKIVGNCTNLLFDDSGFKGTIVCTSNLNEIKMTGPYSFYCESGTLICNLSLFALKNNLVNFEGLCSIPGTIGGGLIMNAGAFDNVISDNLEYIDVYDYDKMKILRLNDYDVKFSYRKGLNKDKYLILGAGFKSHKGEYSKILCKMNSYKKIRKITQPVEKSAGCYFKKSECGESAGKIIDNCGLKGTNVGDAYVSNTHAGFLINKGNATSSNILTLAEIVKKEVFLKNGTILKEEVEYVPPLGSYQLNSK